MGCFQFLSNRYNGAMKLLEMSLGKCVYLFFLGMHLGVELMCDNVCLYLNLLNITN